MITYHGTIEVDPVVVACADSIKLQNYKTSTPKKFQIQPFHTPATDDLMQRMSDLIQVAKDKLDFVYFSVCKGAEPHVDLLDPALFEARTFVIPVILPTGDSTITAEDQRMVVKLNGIYEFNHERIHSMELEDVESGCVVIMVAVKRTS
jgi:hypothetical protein